MLGLALLVASAGSRAETALEAPLAIDGLLLDGAVIGSRIVVVGERGHVLVSTDNGATWTQSRVPTRVLLTAVHMHDERLGWAVGHDAVILRTHDGGTNWQLVHHAPQEQRPLLDVWFRNQQVGYAVGAYGYFLVTEDGGTSWNQRTISEDDYHLNQLTPMGPHQLLIAAEAGVAYRSDDDGETWRELPSPHPVSWFGAHALDASVVLLLGLRGQLFRSTDSGETWTKVATATRAMLTSAVRVQSDLLLITGLEGVLLISRDGGQSVALGQLPARQGISTALALADGSLLLVGEFGVQRLPQIE